MKAILCPTDFSDNAKNAVKYGASLADLFRAKLLLLHVYEIPLMNARVPYTVIDATIKAIRESAEKNLQLVKAKLIKAAPLLKIETIVAEGVPYDQTIIVADKNDVEFIVMGTSGASKLERMVMGSTAAKVIHHADCPVLCIPKTAMFDGIKKIVFATDLHEDNLESARHIHSFARYFDAEIIFVFVDNKHLMHSEESILQMTKKIRSRIKYPKMSGYVVDNDSITKGIEKFLKKYPADVLVMFSHEKHFPGTMFSHSLTRLMSHKAKIPLLALKFSNRPPSWFNESTLR